MVSDTCARCGTHSSRRNRAVEAAQGHGSQTGGSAGLDRASCLTRKPLVNAVVALTLGDRVSVIDTPVTDHDQKMKMTSAMMASTPTTVQMSELPPMIPPSYAKSGARDLTPAPLFGSCYLAQLPTTFLRKTPVSGEITRMS